MQEKKTVLLVDDDADFIDLTTTFLESKGYQVIAAYNGQEGMETARERRPDLIVLDVMMATMTEGFDISRQIKKDEKLKDIPVIMLTGLRKKERLPWTFEPDETWLPVTRFLEKPMSPVQLLKEIEKAIWKREEKEIGKDKYPVYEAIKFVVPGLEKEEAVNFVNFLLKTLERKNLLFKDWQIQRDVRRKVKIEIRIHVLSRFKKYEAKVNGLTEKIFEALEELEWKKKQSLVKNTRL
ncbi:MAG: response regulator [Firmicutes bacterium]|nr:response regulator [Bacillota bacterium]